MGTALVGKGSCSLGAWGAKLATLFMLILSACTARGVLRESGLCRSRARLFLSKKGATPPNFLS